MDKFTSFLTQKTPVVFIVVITSLKLIFHKNYSVTVHVFGAIP